MLFRWYSKRKKAKSEAFIASLNLESNEFLLEAYSSLDSFRELNMHDEYTENERRAVEKELSNRGLEYQADY